MGPNFHGVRYKEWGFLIVKYFSRCGGSVTAGNHCPPYFSSTDGCSAFWGACRLLQSAGLLSETGSLWQIRSCVRRSSAGAEIGSCDPPCFFPLGVRAPRFWTHWAPKRPLRQVELSKTIIFVSALGVQITLWVCCVSPFCTLEGSVQTNLVKFVSCSWILLYSGHKQLMDFYFSEYATQIKSCIQYFRCFRHVFSR